MINIRKILFISVASIFPLIVNAQIDKMDNICSKIPGHWDGIYTIKDQAYCKQYNGCTHLFAVDIRYLSGNQYHADLYPAAGHGGEFILKCENGVITSPVNPGNKISVTCTANNHCFVVYDDPTLTAEARKHS